MPSTKNNTLCKLSEMWERTLLIIVQREVHLKMNHLICIMHNVDIVHIPQPSTDEVTSFANELGPGPKLKPMQLYFNESSKHPWNADLAEQFHN